MLVNNSVTVATEVPVQLDYEDVIHYRVELSFDVPISLKEGEYATGHIDLYRYATG